MIFIYLWTEKFNYRGKYVTTNPGKFLWDQVEPHLNHSGVLLAEKYHILIPFCTHSDMKIQGEENSQMNTLLPST